MQKSVGHPGCSTLICKGVLAIQTVVPWYAKKYWPARWLCFDRMDLKQTSNRWETKLLEKNINLEDISKVLRACASNKRETDRGTFVADSLTDWKPVERMQKRRNTLVFWWPEDYLGCTVLCFWSFPSEHFDETAERELLLRQNKRTQAFSSHQQR